MEKKNEILNLVKEQTLQNETAVSLTNLAGIFGKEAVFSSSFSKEDQIISHMIFSASLSIQIFTLDTGRLFEETYRTWSRTFEKYGKSIESYYPNELELQKFVSEKGPNSFYVSVENRKQCCFIRKVEPLQRALRDIKIWITGIRAAHSGDRNQLEQVEWDESHQLVKYHPLLHWTNEEIDTYIATFSIPYNSLHDKGFVSIGCAPCTRAIQPGDDFRAGRWWWENAQQKECGLHVHAENESAEKNLL